MILDSREFVRVRTQGIACSTRLTLRPSLSSVRIAAAPRLVISSPFRRGILRARARNKRRR